MSADKRVWITRSGRLVSAEMVDRAVNSHDDLVAALKEAIDCIGCELTQDEYDDCMGKINAALAKAEAQS